MIGMIVATKLKSKYERCEGLIVWIALAVVLAMVSVSLAFIGWAW